MTQVAVWRAIDFKLPTFFTKFNSLWKPSFMRANYFMRPLSRRTIIGDFTSISG